MNDEALRCDHCTSFMALTPGPELNQKRAVPPQYFKRGYVIERPKRTYFICQPCLNAIVVSAVA